MNIKKSLPKSEGTLRKLYGKIIVDLKKGAGIEAIMSTLSKTPGIVNFSPCYKEELDIDKIIKKSLMILDTKKFITFKVSSKRTNKKFPLKSDDIDRLLGEKILDHYNGDSNIKGPVSVNLKNPQITVYVEISEKDSYIYVDKFLGVGGLPTGPSGRVVVSLSGGIDSPVATCMIMRRGCRAILVHIHNNSVQGAVVKDKIISLSKIISSYQPGVNTYLYIVPFDKIQKHIIMSVDPKLRMIVYRRFMMKILNLVAAKEHAKAVVTGDSVAQVASQTLDNLICINDASVLPVLSPLIGTNKEETVTMAKKLGTFDTSIIPGNDCCSFMIAKSPQTHASLSEIMLAEERIDKKEELVQEAVKEAEVQKF